MAGRFGMLFAAAAASLLTGCGSGAADVANMPDASMAGHPWPAFYQRAGELFQQGKRDEAVTHFYVGQLRGRIFVRCKPVQADREPAVLASLNATVGQTINEYAGGSPAGWAAAIDQALTWDEAHPDPEAADAGCRAERTQQREGLGDLRRQILATADDIVRQRAAAGLPNR